MNEHLIKLVLVGTHNKESVELILVLFIDGRRVAHCGEKFEIVATLYSSSNTSI